jgi:excisionase family DNA binding protein
MDYITPSSVARQLELSEAAVRKLADAGSLPVAAKLSGRTRLFDREAVATFKKLRSERDPHVGFPSARPLTVEIG